MTDPAIPRTEAGRRDHDLAWEDGSTSPVDHSNERNGCEGCAFIARIEAEAASLPAPGFAVDGRPLDVATGEPYDGCLPAPDGALLSKVWRTIEEATGDTLSKEQLASIFDMYEGFATPDEPRSEDGG